MLYFDKIVLNLFSDSVLATLYVPDAFCFHVVCPLDASCVNIVDDDGAVIVELKEIEVF